MSGEASFEVFKARAAEWLQEWFRAYAKDIAADDAEQAAAFTQVGALLVAQMIEELKP